MAGLRGRHTYCQSDEPKSTLSALGGLEERRAYASIYLPHQLCWCPDLAADSPIPPPQYHLQDPQNQYKSSKKFQVTPQSLPLPEPKWPSLTILPLSTFYLPFPRVI